MLNRHHLLRLIPVGGDHGMFKILFLLFLIIPIIEISILLQLSNVIGGWLTIFVVIFTAWLGAFLVKKQGLETLARIQQKSANGQLPGEELFGGVCILISGVLLLTPGILTDILGFLLLTPVVRHSMIAFLKRKMHWFITKNQPGPAFTFTASHFSSSDDHLVGPEVPSQDDDKVHTVIDGEFKRKD